MDQSFEQMIHIRDSDLTGVWLVEQHGEAVPKTTVTSLQVEALVDVAHDCEMAVHRLHYEGLGTPGSGL